MTKYLASPVAMVALYGLVANSAIAAPITASAPFFWVNNKGPNDIGVGSGLLIAIGDSSVVPNGSAGTTATAHTTNLTTGATVATVVPFQGLFVAPNQFGTNVAYNPSLLGPWTLDFKNGVDTTSVVTGSLVGVPITPFATDVIISGSRSNPTFSWTFPGSTIDSVRVNIYDKTRFAQNGSTDQIYAGPELSGTIGSFTLPTILGGGLSLELHHDYTVDIQASTFRNPSLPDFNSNLISVSQAFFDFRPDAIAGIPEPASILLLGGGLLTIGMVRRR